MRHGTTFMAVWLLVSSFASYWLVVLVARVFPFWESFAQSEYRDALGMVSLLVLLFACACAFWLTFYLMNGVWGDAPAADVETKTAHTV